MIGGAHFLQPAFKMIFVHFAAAIFFFHGHHYGIVKIKGVAFCFDNCSFIMQVILAAFPLAGAFTGGGTFLPERLDDHTIINNMLSVILDPGVFGDRAAFDRLVAALEEDETLEREKIESLLGPARGAPSNVVPLAPKA